MRLGDAQQETAHKPQNPRRKLPDDALIQKALQVKNDTGQAEPEGMQDLQLTEMASRREGGRMCNVHPESNRKMDAAQARQNARQMKAEALGYRTFSG